MSKRTDLNFNTDCSDRP